jgi:gliding motility-associated-like protein
MRLFFALVLMVFFSPNLLATHIVGGEIEFRHISGNSYELSLIVYFDELLGNPQALDQDVDLSLFERSSHQRIANYNLPLISNTSVSYTNPECASRVNIRTRKLLYRRVITLIPRDYSSPQGYYFAHERCCRNGTIANIINPGEAGQTFYLELPPLWQNGQHFINSSPRLFPPLSDFACVDKPFYVDFGGIDDDGDSLVYSLAIPLNGCSDTNDPKPNPPSPANSCRGLPTPGGFYRRVTLRNGFSLTNLIRGKPALAIDKDGFLTITPSERGTFVFAVVCEEYRNGKRIGWIQREFQMTVVDGCIYDPPKAKMITSFLPFRYYQMEDTIQINAGQGFDSCFPVVLRDPNGTNRFVSRIRTLEPKNNEIYLKGIGTARVNSIDSTTVELCFNDCPRQVGLHRVDVMIGDNSCALPLYDTLKLLFNIKFPQNEPPVVSIPEFSPKPEGSCYDTVFVKTGELVRFDVLVKDKDLGRKLRLSAFEQNNRLEDLGISFPNLTGTDSIRTRFNWLTDCKHLDSLYNPKTFLFKFVTSDTNVCKLVNYDTICVPIHLSLAIQPNIEAVKSLLGSEITLDANSRLYKARLQVGKTLSFRGIIQDFDFDTVAIRATGKDFDFEAVGMSFPRRQGIGTASSEFRWRGDCRNLDIEKGEFSRDYEVYFIGSEKGECKEPRTDTVKAVITLFFVPDPNVAPVASITAANQNSPKNYQIDATVGDIVEFEVLGTDADRDSMILEMQAVGFALAELNAEFSPSNPILSRPDDFEIRGFFRLLTTCGMLAEGNANKSYLYRFVLSDVNTCNLKERDTVNLLLNLRDIPEIPFSPFPNVFTPNSDELNKTYKIENLPIDNCKDQFRFIEVFNRWGKRVFYSQDRNFEWEANEIADGVYFYLVQYANSQYKGTISVIR